jgi:hypothetical protein
MILYQRLRNEQSTAAYKISEGNSGRGMSACASRLVHDAFVTRPDSRKFQSNVIKPEFLCAATRGETHMPRQIDNSMRLDRG